MSGLKSFRGVGWSAVFVVCVVVGACNRGQQTPAVESQTATPAQTTNQPTTVKGCLRAGEASETYVLTAAKSATGDLTATYQLQPMQGVSLAEHVGRQVEVSGVVVAQQEIATRSATQPAGKAEGTTGTPTVSTTTELDIKKLNVQQVRRLEDSCPDEKR
jgi:hypothetical protein